MKIQTLNMAAIAVILLATCLTVKSESWSWNKSDNEKKTETEGAERRVDMVEEKSQQQEPAQAQGEGRHLFSTGEEILSNDTSVENVVDDILFSSRQGRALEGYDEVYTDPTVQEALQKGDDVEARNLIKQKLCSLGLMSCGPEEIIGKRPFRGPPPSFYYNGPPPNGPPKGPFGHSKGPYGPPRPLPPPPGKFGPPRKVGYDGFPISKPYPGKPLGPYGLNDGETFERPPPGATIVYDSKPPGNVFEGADAPYNFEHADSKIHVNHNGFQQQTAQSQTSFLHTKPIPSGIPQFTASNPVGAATTLQQHVHHHFHHVEGTAAKGPNVVINNPVPVPLATGNSITSEFSSLAATSGGFSPVAGGSGIGSNHISSASGLNSGYAGSYGLLQSGFNGVNSGANGLYGSGIKPVKEYESPEGPLGGPFGGSQGGSFGGYGSGGNGGYGSGGNGGYASGANGGYASGTNGGYASGANGGYASGANGGFASGSNGGFGGSFGGSGGFNGGSQSFHSTNPDYYKKELNNGGSLLNGGSNFAQENKFSSQYNGLYSQFANAGGDSYQGFETARQQQIDCVCIPFNQCPASDRIGRKDDLILPLDPRNLKTDIEALSDEAVITDGNGTMITVRVPKDVGSAGNVTAPQDAPKKISKREAASSKQDGAQDPATNIEGRNDDDRYTTFGISRRKVLPTFGVSFGLPFPTGAYPVNPFGQNPAQNQHFGSISPNGLNLGLLNVNPLLSLQVTKNEFGEKLVKPLVNLHVTPNEHLIHKVGSLFAAKKQALVNQHYHHHTHHPGSYYEPGPHHHGYPGGHFGGPEIYTSPGPQFGTGFGPSYPSGFGGVPAEIDFNPYGGYNPYSRSANDGNQSFFPSGNGIAYANGFDYTRQAKQLQYESPTNAIQQTPTQAPGAAPGGKSISFPNNRRRRRSVDGVEDSKNNEQIDSHTSRVVEKRQAYYGGGPQQCGPQHVCCRRPFRPPQQQLGRCGTRNAHGVTGRIKNPVYVDGDSEFGEYPWQAAILKKDPKESIYVCGGTIIDAQHILTAAHCIKTYSGFDLRVRLGEWDVNHDVEFFPYIERDIISVHIHPEYYAGTLDNDLAILKLNQPIDFTKSPHISPACLPDKFSDFTGARCWTTGWGKDAFGEFGKYQNILKEVDVPIIHQQQCQEQLRHTRLGFNYHLHPGFICAGGEEGKDACKGDGGGPLVCDRNGIWHVVGVVSWGIGCGQVNVPGVYVRVSHYLDWIQTIARNY